MAILLVIFLLELSAKRCDKYVMTSGDYASSLGAQLYDITKGDISGCKKGCFPNNTYTDYGARKCEKCSNIEDREFCQKWDTCQWTKGGKCKSASCPQLAKNKSKNSDDKIEQFENCTKIVETLKSNADKRCNNAHTPASVANCLATYGYGNQTYCDYDWNRCLSSARTAVADGYWYWNPDQSNCHIGPGGNPLNPGPEEDDDWQCGECAPDSSGYYCGGRQQCYDQYGYKPPSPKLNKFEHNLQRKTCHSIYGCMYTKTKNRCAAWSVWAFVLVLVLLILVVLAIIAVVCFILIKKSAKKTVPVSDKSAESVKSAESASVPAADSSSQANSNQAAQSSPQATGADKSPVVEVGPYVVIKLGKQELKTKKVESAVWGENIVFNGLGPEDDDVLFELHDNGGALLGSADVRIPDYVNTKKRAKVNLKNGGADIGVLEADIEIQVQEKPEVKITGILFVDKFLKV